MIQLIRCVLFLAAFLAAAAVYFAKAEEVWQCDQHSSAKKVYTTTPVRSTDTECRPSKLNRASYSTVAAIRPVPPRTVTQETPNILHDAPEKESEKPFLSWKSEEHQPQRGESVRCKLHGEAAAQTGGSGTLIVHRGGAQLEHFPILLKGKRTAVHWQLDLAGPCRNPEVRLKAP